ncbi:hypothetical protein [Nitrosovibrio sp. Nv6]|uniref:hypothetical protein n=1 Tax=Nitrosovibrio sp. Nv6 TaxID=1855340 RepID=UPI0008D35DB8|nr:hypothetical protein [Nitrosovibrio sp. Nv6]SEO34994.1 hypothetical protein SAMN05216316_0022 [Nitrosovibrio sp. Nv6]
MKPITGTASITNQPDTVVPPAPPHTYFGVAQSLIPGVKILAAASPPQNYALALVAAHVLECLLKAYLSRNGSDAHIRKRKLRHDLKVLWEMAFEQGLHIPKSPSSWVDCLSSLHAEPYHLRYSSGVHGIVLPSAEPMTSELAALLEVVRDQLKSRSNGNA